MAADETAFCSSLPRELPLDLSYAEGNFLTFADVIGDEQLHARILQAEAADLALYSFARERSRAAGVPLWPNATADRPAGSVGVGGQARLRAAWSTPAYLGIGVPSSPPVPASLEPQRCDGQSLCLEPSVPNATRRSWVDSFFERLHTLQKLSPPRRQHAIVFTHVPKCGGSSFRNNLLLEFTRLHRAPSSFACVFYRDVFFREARGGSDLVKQGPSCIARDGKIKSQLMVVTGHISLHPELLSRLRVPHSAVVFLRNPLTRLGKSPARLLCRSTLAVHGGMRLRW